MKSMALLYLMLCLSNTDVAAQNTTQVQPVSNPSSTPSKTETPTRPLVLPTPTTPAQALNRLMEGNKRFMKDEMTCPERNQVRRQATLAKQKPFAVVLGCSDSRVPPEFAFDQGIGDVFVVRIAGNVASTLEMQSIEYSALANNSLIVMVLGHRNCGAVTAVLENKTHDIEAIADLIKPAVIKAHENHDDLEVAIKANVYNSMARVKRSPIISKLMKEGRIDVVGGYYDLETGEVTLLPPQAQSKDQKK